MKNKAIPFFSNGITNVVTVNCVGPLEKKMDIGSQVMQDNKAIILVPGVMSSGVYKHWIKRGSAIVAIGDRFESTYLVYYEGNIYNASNLQTFEERLCAAYGRMICRYPTAAKMTVEKDSMLVVGEFDGKTIQLSNRPALDQWCLL